MYISMYTHMYISMYITCMYMYTCVYTYIYICVKITDYYFMCTKFDILCVYKCIVYMCMYLYNICIYAKFKHTKIFVYAPNCIHNLFVCAHLLCVHIYNEI